MKTGRWVYKDTFMGITSESKGRYKKDFEVGTWKDYIGNKLNTKRKYKDSICYTTEYHKNGKIRAFGIQKWLWKIKICIGFYQVSGNFTTKTAFF